MMTEHSKRNLEQALHRSLQSNLVRSPDDVYSVSPVAGVEVADDSQTNLQVITISSFAFRLLILFRLASDAASRAYFGGGEQSHENAFCEIANLCCGAMSRELSQHVSHIAMSIPYTLSCQCLAFMDELKPQYLSTCAVTINDAVQLQVSLCVCCSGQVDFAETTAAVQHGTGELEML